MCSHGVATPTHSPPQIRSAAAKEVASVGARVLELERVHDAATSQEVARLRAALHEARSDASGKRHAPSSLWCNPNESMTLPEARSAATVEARQLEEQHAAAMESTKDRFAKEALALRKELTQAQHAQVNKAPAAVECQALNAHTYTYRSP